MKKNLFFLLLSFIIFGSSSAWALDQVDGVYQIGTAQDFADFAAIVNSDGRKQDRNAVVTADFTVSDLVMIGAPSNAYRGTFDGQGHTITVNYTMESTGQNGECGLFRRVNGGTIKNIIVDGTITTKGQLAGGVISGIWQKAVVENCISYVTINDTQSGDGTHGGIVARISDKSDITIRNCAFLGTINAPERTGSGGILGWPDNASTQVKIENCLMAGTLNLATGSDNDVIVRNTATVTNCYYTDLQGMNNTKNATAATANQLTSGELCFLLNGSQSETNNWFQTIDTDNTPLPIGTSVVYAIGALDCSGSPKGSVTYSNTEGEAERDAHQWSEWGFCSVCDEMQPDFLTIEDGYYLIGNEKEYNWYMVWVNNKGNGHTNVKLTADIDMNGYNFIPLGVDGSKFTGIFDGQGHRIKNMTIDGTKKEQGLFSVCGGGAVIKNLIIDSSCKMNGTGGANVAALIGCINGNTYGETVTIQNVGNEMDMTVTTTNNAGFVARDWSSYLKLVIENCYNTGNIYGGTENGAFTAWTPRVTLTNCWNTGRIEKTGNYDGSKSLARGNQPSFVNSYDLNTANSDNAGQPTGYQESWLASGELAYFMNGNQSENVNWYQKLGDDADAHPYPFGTYVVYANGDVKCDGVTPKEGATVSYSNTEGGNRDDHQWSEWGFCSVCDEIQPDFMTANGDYYEIETPKQLNWFAVYAAKVDNTVNAKIMNDIDVTTEVANFPGIASETNPFKGEIDGQFNIVNIKMDYDRVGVGFVNAAAEGVTIKNLTITGEVKGTQAAGGFIGRSSGNGAATLTNIGNEATVTTTNQNAGGLVGCNFSGELKYTVTNAYNVGTITSGWEAGGLSGWFGNNAEMHNVYNAGTVNGGESFGRGNNIQLNETSYDIATNWPGMYVITNDSPVQVVDGTLTDALADNVWHQALGEGSHPVLHKNYDLDETFSHHKFYAHADANISMARTTVANTWNTICLPFALDADEIATIFGSDAQVAEFDSYDAAADNYSFKSVTEMEAGKAYLVKSSTALSAPVVLTGKALVTEAVANDFFKGDFNPQAVAVGDKIVAANNIAMNVNKADRIKGFRAFFPSQGGEAKDGTFTVDGESTGIIAIENGELNAIDFNGAVYDLQGRKVSTPKHGVYVVNGKKVVIK